MERQKKLLVFDMDGVLFDSGAVADAYFMHMYPGLTKEMCRDLLCENFHTSLEKIEHLRRLETEEEREVRRAEFKKKKTLAPMYPGARELLETLHGAGHTLVLNTSATEHNSLPMLERANISSFFDFVAHAEVSKSKEEKFRMLEEKYSVPTAEQLFVTDTLGDLREAHRAGVPTVAVTWGAHDRSFFAREAHENLIAVVDSMGELLELIQAQ